MWHAERGAPAPIAWEDFSAWCAQHRGQGANVLVSNRLMHSLVADAALPLAAQGDVLAHARAQFIHYHGASAGDWPTAAWMAGPVRGASALHGLDLAALRQQALAHDVRLLSVVPYWSTALRACARVAEDWARRDGRSALGLFEGTHATWMLIVDGAFAAMRTRRLASACSADVSGLVEELALADDVPIGQVVVAGHGIAEDAQAAPLATRCRVHLTDRPHPAVAWLFE